MLLRACCSVAQRAFLLVLQLLCSQACEHVLLHDAILSEGYSSTAQALSLDVWCSVQELDRWEERLEELFAGRPYDIYDAALTATISDFPVSIQPFRDMVGCCHSQCFAHSLRHIRAICHLWLTLLTTVTPQVLAAPVVSFQNTDGGGFAA